MSELHVNELSHRYRGVEVLQSISFSLAPGEIFALMGGSGTGKSTLLKCLAGLEKQHTGTITLGGQTMDETTAAKRPVVLMFQDALLFPHMTLRENVAYALKTRGVKRQVRSDQAAVFLEKVGMLHAAERLPEQCSGGEKQRVALARALIAQPALLLLDEPFASLDETLRFQMLRWAKSLLKEAGTTAVFVTHAKDEAVAMGDTIGVMHEGRLFEKGSPAALARRPLYGPTADALGDGVRIGSTFVPASAVKVHRFTSNDDDAGWKAQVQSLFQTHGQLLVCLEVAGAAQALTIPAPFQMAEGEWLYISADSDSLVELAEQRGEHDETK
ncbi:iron(III) transport system ATP-binding protein [Salsuginibacillus halophilus]|uniref:Iron(III) transport system ATP-binding protein n=1 Tax=Salsuginibacillus halophilus TaxID=517424 RepID=A0A2P8H8R8_9BACI|nr:ABC transporter ATP-binding protein [Salsuginibacillus halophilus]PSL42604.1 iron(III) transport system ATP-binding protein [Salsuginibacillus halophilus]